MVGFYYFMQLHHLADNIFTIEGFWTNDQCRDFIVKSEAIGYEAATVDTEKGQIVIDSVRNNHRVIYKDHRLAEELWKELMPFAPEKIGNSFAVGLNELFRFYKYQPGQQFRKHRDQSFIRNHSEASYYTFMIYLNDHYEGGETSFNELIIKPATGMALVFLHGLEHAGNPVMQGVKYVLRTDIMYRLEETP
jgi:predicted 2-oxoglutarate/Fe(II)-dependent dioxygenase YbiX